MKNCNFKITVFIAVALLLSICLVACGNNNKESSNSTKNNSLFESATSNQVESTTEKEISFKEANILSFTLADRDDDSYDEIISHFKITNNGKTAVDYVSIDYTYYDKDKNVICDDSRFLDFQIDTAKSAMAISYSDLDDNYKKSDIKFIEVTSYTYYVGDKGYDIDLETQKVNEYEHNLEKNIDFDKANILSFQYNDKGINSIDSYEVAVKVHNNGKQKVVYCSIDVAYLDKDGTFLDSDGRYNDNGFDSGKFTSINSYMSKIIYSHNVKSFGVYKYSYRFAEDDENGNNSYTVNLQTKEVTGTHSDN